MLKVLDYKLKRTYAHLRPKKGVSRRKNYRVSAKSNSKYLLLGRRLAVRGGVVCLVVFLGLGLVFLTHQIQAVGIGEVSYVGGSGVYGGEDSAFEEELHELIFDQLQTSYWSLDLVSLATSVESHPWVNRATIKRQWPNKLIFGIDQHVPVARWNKRSLLLAAGEIISVQDIGNFQYLPQFLGVARTISTASDVRFAVDRFNQIQREITDLEWQVNQMIFGGKDSIAIVLRDGPRIELGVHSHLNRLRRVKVMAQTGLIKHWEKLSSIDARYGRGVAIRWDTADTMRSVVGMPVRSERVFGRDNAYVL